jgi:DNA invertase Pin-like site-specific DNA recombinase
MKPRVAIYAHTSEKRDDINEQIYNCRIFAVEQGWQTFDIFLDENLPDVRTDRPDLSLLKLEAAAGYFDVVLCDHSDRITPNIWEIRDFLVNLYNLGVRSWSVQEGSLDGMRVWLQETLPDLDNPADG